MFFGVVIPELLHCYACGGKLDRVFTEGKYRKVCSVCRTINYQNPVPSVAVIITDDEGRLLLTKRAAEPGIGLWCLPGGFIELGENPLDTLVRETKEETGLDVVPGEIIDACAKLNGFHGDVVIIGYTAVVTGGILTPGDDAVETVYFELNELPQIAFRSHIHFIEKHFRIKIERQDERKFH